MIIIEFLGKVFIDILFEGIFLGFFRLIGKGISKLETLFSGQKSPIDPKRTLEKKYLYKRFVLQENLNEIIKKGTPGAVLEIIDKNLVYVEFYDINGKQIEFNNELVFKVKLNAITLEK
ncbi:MAG: hypothetical protein GY705_18540 [Bacteroidetes bacterium]|nr:hypothetical protein [Bacteroidota bacterium]